MPPSSRASSRRRAEVYLKSHNHLGQLWELARDSGRSGCIELECAANDYAASAAMAARTLGRVAIRAMNAASAGQSLIWILNNGSQFRTVNK